MYRVVDLFAGAGGMSLGFLQTGRYEIAVAVEKHSHAKATYKHNHKHAELLGDILEITNYQSFQQQYGPFDLVVGGPPCQGFSNANRQKNHLISQNNSLVKKYIEVIENIKPKAFVMENVRMLRSETHRFYRSRNDGFDFDQLGICTRKDTLELMDSNCGVDDVSEYLLDQEIVNELILPKKIYDVVRVAIKGISKLEQEIYIESTNGNTTEIEKKSILLEKKRKQCLRALKSIPQRSARISCRYIAVELASIQALKQCATSKISLQEAESIVTNFVNLQRLLMAAKELLDNNIIINRLISDGVILAEVQSYSVIDYINKKLGNTYQIHADVLNAASFGAPQLRQRYIAVGLRKDLLQSDIKIDQMLPNELYKPEEYRTVSDAISDLEEISPSFNVNEKAVDLTGKNYLPTALTSGLRNSGKLTNHIVTETTETAMKRFEALEQGENFHDLDIALIEDTYSVPERTQNSIYLRLDYNKPCGTVTNVRKSMWIHPTIDRAVSVREAARLQTFPDDFEFLGSKDSQYQQVGNAVPPFMARAIAARLKDILDLCRQNELGGSGEHGGHLLSGATPPCDVKDTFKEYEPGNDRTEISA